MIQEGGGQIYIISHFLLQPKRGQNVGKLTHQVKQPLLDESKKSPTGMSIFLLNDL